MKLDGFFGLFREFNYAKESSNEVHISDDVPQALMEELFNYVVIVLKKQKECFHIDHAQKGRYDLLDPIYFTIFLVLGGLVGVFQRVQSSLH